MNQLKRFSNIKITNSSDSDSDSDDLFDKYLCDNDSQNHILNPFQNIKNLLTNINKNYNDQIIGFKIYKKNIYISTNCIKITDCNNINHKDVYGLYTDDYVFGLIPFISSKTIINNNYVIKTNYSKVYKLELSYTMVYIIKYAAEMIKKRIEEVGLDYIKEKEFNVYNIF